MTDILMCVECSAPMPCAQELTCPNCRRSYQRCGGVPVLMRLDNPLFPPNAYTSTEGGRGPDTQRSKLAKIRGAIPGRSLNLERLNTFKKISDKYNVDQKKILILGCGNQAEQVKIAFENKQVEILSCDVDKKSDSDYFCDAHNLPFLENSFFGIITTAVLEHVAYPNKVVSEIHRVLEPGGFLYSEIPFLQAVHEGAYDFTRYTLGGHRILLDKFGEVEAGMIAGPGTSLVWAITEYAKALSPNKKVASALGTVAQATFFWLKYSDKMMKNNPRAMDAAACTYYWGEKSENEINIQDIIELYGKSDFSHT